jgi:hypothetical protein
MEMTAIIEARLTRVEHRVDKTLDLVRRVNARYANIMSAQKHYLKKRAPGVLAKQRDRRSLGHAIKILEGKLAKIPKMSVAFTRKSKGRDSHNVVLMVDHNQARKIRRLADMNMQGMTGKINYLIRISGQLKKIIKQSEATICKSTRGQTKS